MVIITRRIAGAGGLAACLAVLSTSLACTQFAPPIEAVPSPSSTVMVPARDVVLVGNNWEGRVVVFDPAPPFRRLGSFNVVPDRALLQKDIDRSLTRQAQMRAIRNVAGEGHDQLVDDVFTSPDGRYLYASRPSHRDVVAIDLTNPGSEIPHWRTRVDGARADHAAISPDGTRLLVSASTADRVHEIDTATGAKLRHFRSGDEPHESNYSHDGRKIFHASIGHVFLPTTSPVLDPLKGRRIFQIVDAKTFTILDRFDMREQTKAFGHEWKDSAVRPMAISPDDNLIYFQLSFLHGFYVFNVKERRITDWLRLPGADVVDSQPATAFQLNSADHGITISGDGEKLCVAGTLTGRAYIVRTKGFAVTPIDLHDPPRKGEEGIHKDLKPYWSTTSADGKNCYISISEKNEVVVISFVDEKVVGRVDVGPMPGARNAAGGAGSAAAMTVVHPQRVRTGRIQLNALEKADP